MLTHTYTPSDTQKSTRILSGLWLWWWCHGYKQMFWLINMCTLNVCQFLLINYTSIQLKKDKLITSNLPKLWAYLVLWTAYMRMDIHSFVEKYNAFVTHSHTTVPQPPLHSWICICHQRKCKIMTSENEPRICRVACLTHLLFFSFLSGSWVAVWF